MKLFRAFGLIFFLIAAKTILLSGPYTEFEAALSQFFRTSNTALKQTENILNSTEFTNAHHMDSYNLVPQPVINFER